MFRTILFHLIALQGRKVRIAAATLLAIVAPALDAAPRLITPDLPPSKLGIAYSARLLLTSASPIQSVNIGGLPNGMIAGHDGFGTLIFSGTPTVAGNHVVTLAIGDSTGATLSASIPLPVIPLAGSVTSITVGLRHTCAIVGGGVQCWGYGYLGELGFPATVVDTPTQAVPHGTGATQVSAGAGHTCAVISGGVKCWGANADAQLGNGTTSGSPAPVEAIAAMSDVTQVSAGTRHTCAVANGGLWCWGANDFGQFGNGGFSSSQVPVQVLPSLSGVTAVSAGEDFTCAIISAGVRCAGRNHVGQLGVNNGQSFTANLQQPLAQGSGATALAAGKQHACAVVLGGVQCWGAGGNGQTGVNNAGNALTPVSPIPAASGATAISAGEGSTCAVVNTGLRCWGGAIFGDPMQNKVLSTFVPIQVLPNGSGVGQVSLGASHSCIVINGRMRCAGRNVYGAIGIGNTGYTRFPVVSVAASVNVSAVRASRPGLARACAVANGGVICWGNHSGQYLGPNLPTTAVRSVMPVAVIDAGGGVTSVDVGVYHSCAVVSGGVRCWGYNADGELGSGATSATLADALPAGSGATEVATGRSHSCAVVSGGLRCWGANSSGQLGNGNTASSHSPISIFPAGSGVSAVAAGGDHTCAVVNGGVKCWGSNFWGALGNGTQVDSNVPVDALPAGSGATSVASSNDHVCAIVAGGVKCWGMTTYGKVGIPNDPVYIQTSPVQAVPPGSNVAAITAGGLHSCALINGGVKCWGYTDMLGSFVGLYSHVPVTVIAEDSGISSVSAGEHFTCVAARGGVACWGQDNSGELASDELAEPWTYRDVLIFEAPPRVVSAVSRKQHGAAGIFDIPILLNVPVSGAITVEPRSGGTGHTLILTFDKPVETFGGIALRDYWTGSVAGNVSVVPNGNEVVVNLTNVPIVVRSRLQLGSINGSPSSQVVPIGFLLGDTDGSRAVNPSDVLRTRARLHTPIDANTFLYDINLNGTVSLADFIAVKTQNARGLILP